MIIILTQVLYRQTVIVPYLYNSSYQGSILPFILAVIATLCLAAAGYAINDYFDIRIDRINKPGKIIVGRLLSRRQAIFSHSVLNVAGVAISLYLSYKVWSVLPTLAILAAASMLWLYSLRIKRSFLLGNLAIAMTSALVIGLIWMMEVLEASNLQAYTVAPGSVSMLTTTYIFFAFMASLIREVVKDMEDMQGDRAMDCRSMALVWGIRKTKLFLFAAMIILVAGMAFLQAYLWRQQNWLPLVYLMLTVQLPVAWMAVKTHRALEKNDFRVLQQVMKYIMVAGILSMALI